MELFLEISWKITNFLNIDKYISLFHYGFINNSVSVYGGAIYVGNGSIVDIKANHANVVFSGNKSNFNGTFYDNTSSAIAVFDSVLNLSSYVDEDDYIIFKDSQNIFFNNASTINLNSAKLQFLNNEGINGDGVLNLDGTTTLTTTVDLANNKMPKIDAGSVTGNGDIQINKIILTSDASSEKTTIEFTSTNGLKEKVSYVGDNGVSYSNIYKYNVNYDGATGNFTFLRSESFNPVLHAKSIAKQSIFATHTHIHSEGFRHVALFAIYTGDCPLVKSDTVTNLSRSNTF